MQVYLVLIALQYVIEGEHVASILCFCTVVGVEQIIPCILLCFYSRSLSSVIEYSLIGIRYARTWAPLILCFSTVVGVEQIIPCILLFFYSRSLSSVIEYGSIGTRYPRTWSPFVLDWELP